MAWRIAESLKTLREQINEAYPKRDKRSDGGIGDADHASRNSDHNPWVKDRDGVGVVTAIDIDEDLAADIHSIENIVTAIRKSRDPRVKYIIYEKRITVPGSDLQKWKPYKGKNPHDHHAHISVNSDPKLYDSRRKWDLGDLNPFSNLKDDEIVLDLTDSAATIIKPAKREPTLNPEIQLPPNSEPPPIPDPHRPLGLGDAPVQTETVTQTVDVGGQTASVTETTSTSGDPLEVKAEKSSVWTSLVALGTAALGIWQGAQQNFAEMLGRAQEAVDIKFVIHAATGAGLVVLGVWLYNRARERAHDKTLALISTAANKDQHTIKLVK
jgi:hypothetical protein